jgi:two-component system nitrate/nitrite response regulator NarL
MTRNPDLHGRPWAGADASSSTTAPARVGLLASSAAARQELAAAAAGQVSVVVDGAVDAILWASDGGPLGATGDVPVIAIVRDAAAAAPALAAGARGVLLRDSVPEGLLAAIAAVRLGHTLIDHALTASLIPSTAPRTTAPTKRQGAGGHPGDDLTERELQVVRLLAEGLSNKLIADRLGISDHTAKFHVNGVMTKLAAATRTEAVVEAMRRGLVAI